MEQISLVRRLSQITTRLQSFFFGIEQGHDEFGNRYYRARHTPKGVREKRWVIYSGEPEASKVPPDWHIWLHHTAAQPLNSQDQFHKSWQKPHQQNMTGTAQAYYPPGHVLEGGQRRKATGDFQAWQPEK